MPENKARYWVGVLYTENMIPDWQDVVDDKIQVPFAYCRHNVCKDSKGVLRKDHVHMITVYPNTTTYNHAMSVYEELSAPGKSCINKCVRVIDIRHMYDYLIHDTDKCRQQGKHLYDPSERITGNNFDIGSYEQVSAADKERMCRELCDYIIQNNFTNFRDLYMAVVSNFDDRYFEVLRTNHGFLSALTKGNFLKVDMEQRMKNSNQGS